MGSAEIPTPVPTAAHPESPIVRGSRQSGMSGTGRRPVLEKFASHSTFHTKAATGDQEVGYSLQSGPTAMKTGQPLATPSGRR